MFEGDPGVFFGPLTGVDIGRMPTEVLPDRLGWGLERYADVGPYAELRLASAETLRAEPGDPEAADFGRELLMLEPLLDGALTYESPSPAGMGLVAWDKAVPDVPEAGAGVEKKARRMARRLFTEDDDDDLPRRRPETPDPETARRCADLVDALVRVRALETKVAADGHTAARAGLVNLRVDLQRRLARERRHDAAVDARLPSLARLTAADAAALRAAAAPRPPESLGEPDAPATTVRVERTPSGDNPYLAALEAAEARLSEPLAQAPVASGVDAERLAGVQRAAAEAVERAVGGGRGADRAAARARRLLAHEVALSAGRPGMRSDAGVDTLALRRRLEAAHPAPAEGSPAADALVAGPGLPELPVLSSRGAAARVLAVVPAGHALSILGPAQKGFYPVGLGGRRGWVPETLVQRHGDRPLPWPQPLTPTNALPTLPTSPGAARHQARLTGPARGPIEVRTVVVDAPPQADGETDRVVADALGVLPDVLASRMRGRPARRSDHDELTLVLDLPPDGRDARVRGRILADQLADALVRVGADRLETLRIELRGRPVRPELTPEGALERVAEGDTEGLAQALAAERRTLDAATRSRLSSFFGHDFSDVMVFAGPMSGAMARSLSAEAFTHGKMVFFDPKHFRPDTARGEALLAHELTHTRQADSERTEKAKEAEALAAEARFLDWVSPGGAPLAKELDEEVAATRPSAQAAGDARAVGKGVQRAETGRHLEASEGPRADTAKFEERVKNVLERVRTMLSDRGDFEADRIGRLVRAGILHL